MTSPNFTDKGFNRFLNASFQERVREQIQESRLEFTRQIQGDSTALSVIGERPVTSKLSKRTFDQFQFEGPTANRCIPSQDRFLNAVCRYAELRVI